MGDSATWHYCGLGKRLMEPAITSSPLGNERSLLAAALIEIS